MATPTTKINAHPKVFYGWVAAGIVSILGFIAAAATPEAFAPLGTLAVPLSMLVVAVAQGLIAWLKRSEPKVEKKLPETVSVPLPAAAAPVVEPALADTPVAEVVTSPSPSPKPRASRAKATTN